MAQLVARPTPDRKAACSSHVGVIFFFHKNKCWSGTICYHAQLAVANGSNSFFLVEFHFMHNEKSLF